MAQYQKLSFTCPISGKDFTLNRAVIANAVTDQEIYQALLRGDFFSVKSPFAETSIQLNYNFIFVHPKQAYLAWLLPQPTPDEKEVLLHGLSIQGMEHGTCRVFEHSEEFCEFILSQELNLDDRALATTKYLYARVLHAVAQQNQNEQAKDKRPEAPEKRIKHEAFPKAEALARAFITPIPEDDAHLELHLHYFGKDASGRASAEHIDERIAPISREDFLLSVRSIESLPYGEIKTEARIPLIDIRWAKHHFVTLSTYLQKAKADTGIAIEDSDAN